MKKTDFGGDDLGTIWCTYYGYTLSEVITDRIQRAREYHDYYDKYPYTFVKINRTWWGKVRSITVYHSVDELEREPMFYVYKT